MKHSNRKISKRNNPSSEAAGPVKIDCAFDELVPIGKVMPYPRNPVVHPEKQIARLAKIIAGTGWRNPIVISRRSGYVVKGHGRLAAAARLGMDAVPVDWQDYATDEEEKADRIADNKIAELAEDNLEALLAEMTDINLAGADLDMLGMDDSELESLLSQIEGGGKGEVDDNFSNGNFESQYAVTVICSGEADQQKVYERLTKEGLNCKVVCV
jgi:ParB-like chromosome segregation protein Spo0J